MFRSLHMKLVIILILLIVSVMAIMGTFGQQRRQHYLNDFETQIENVMTENNYETYRSLEQAAQNPMRPSALWKSCRRLSVVWVSTLTVPMRFWMAMAPS
ncbi:MAG: hypothetical protein ACLUB2_00585 [Butyricicoccus pullicaecorum]